MCYDVKCGRAQIDRSKVVDSCLAVYVCVSRGVSEHEELHCPVMAMLVVG